MSFFLCFTCACMFLQRCRVRARTGQMQTDDTAISGLRAKVFQNPIKVKPLFTHPRHNPKYRTTGRVVRFRIQLRVPDQCAFA